MAALAPEKTSGRVAADHSPPAARVFADADGTAGRDGAGSPSLPSSGGSPPARADRLLELARGIDQPFTAGLLVGAAERDGIPVSEALTWLRDAEDAGAIRPTGARRGSATALRGSRLFTAVP